MEKKRQIAVAALAAMALAHVAGAVTYDESIDGDLSTDAANPTVLNLDVGTHSILGTTINSPLDRDFFTITIGANQSLTSLVLVAYESDAAPSFIALVDQDHFNTLNDPTNYLGATFVFQGQIGNDLLPDLANAPLGGEGFTAPLGPGVYTIWYQETGAPTTYQFDVTIVPEPGSLALLGLGSLAVLRRRR